MFVVKMRHKVVRFPDILLVALIIPLKIVGKEETCSGKSENNEGFVKIAAVEIQVRAHLDNLNKIKLVATDVL